MLTEKEYTQEIDAMSGFRSLVRAYQQIASVRMKKTREAVVSNRDYLDQIEAIFDAVRESYAREAQKLATKKSSKKDTITFLSHNGKNVVVLLSANSGLYGEVLESTYEAFSKEVKSSPVEVTIVGKHGRGRFVSEYPTKPFTFFEISDEKFESSELNELIRHIVQYDEIHIYYEKFINVIKQIPDKYIISSEVSLTKSDKKETISYLFEPSLEKILMFFETQVFGARMEQIAREGQLAKFASRVMAMDRANENIRERIGKLELGKLRARHAVTNRKQLNRSASMRLWS